MRRLLILTLFFASCSSSEFIINKHNEKTNINTNHWVTFKEPKNSKKLLASLESSQIATKSNASNLSINVNTDSVEIITKTGQKYIGTITKSDYSGYFIKVNNNRVIYLGNQEIKTITFFDNIKTENISIDSSEIFQNKNTESTIVENIKTNNIIKDEVIKEQKYIGEKEIEKKSLYSFLFAYFLFGFGSIPAIILSKKGKKKIDENPEKYKGRGFAVAGGILGWIGLIFSSFFIFIVLIFGL